MSDTPAPPTAQPFSEAELPEVIAILNEGSGRLTTHWAARIAATLESLRADDQKWQETVERQRKAADRHRDERAKLEAENAALRKDKERLDWLDTLPSGISILGDANHPSQCCTPKAPGDSHTRWLIDDNRQSRARAAEKGA